MLTVSRVGTCMLHQGRRWDTRAEPRASTGSEQAVPGDVASALGATQLATFLAGLSPVLPPDYQALGERRSSRGASPVLGDR